MLVAATRSKLKRKTDLWEDEVTSIIFGPLIDMPAKDVWHFLRRMAIDAGIESNMLPLMVPVGLSLQFWPRHRQVESEIVLNIEPDVVFNFVMPDGSNFNVMLEIKWEKGKLTPRCELVRQWLTRPACQENWVHIYLVPSEANGSKDIKESVFILRSSCEDNSLNCCQKNPYRYNPPQNPNRESLLWQRCLGAISWRHVQQETQRISVSAADTVLGRWAKGVMLFLERQDYTPFIGFSWLAECQYQSLDNSEFGWLFAKADWFSFVENENYSTLDGCFDLFTFLK